jgi:outer membrane immunogenic protein
MRHSTSIVAIMAALICGSAAAADLPSRKAPPVYVPPPPPILWTGFYGGLNLGGGWSSNNNNNNVELPFYDPNFAFGQQLFWPGFGNVANGLIFLPSNNNNGNNGGVIGGGQVGYNYQFGTSIVIGAEADIQGTSIGNNNNGNTLVAYPSPFAGGSVLVPLGGNIVGNASVPWFGTVRGRAGWLVTPTLLLYGTGGFAYGGINAGGYSTTATGWTAGGGVEWMFLPNWSAKLEYLYVRATSSNYNNNQGWFAGYGFSNASPAINVVRAGVNYHFNWAPPAPVVAKY